MRLLYPICCGRLLFSLAEGSVIFAHKIILASQSLYCEKQFHGPWASIAKEDPHQIRLPSRELLRTTYYEDAASISQGWDIKHRLLTEV